MHGVSSCVWLCDPMDYRPPGSSVHKILKARILEWAAIPFSRGSSSFRDQTQVSCVSCSDRQILYHWATWEALWYSNTVGYGEKNEVSLYMC